MGWKKGQPRGKSPLKDRKVLTVDVRLIQRILDDQGAAPEVRFCAVMEMVLPAMMESTNTAVAAIGTSLSRFWNTDMERTRFYTPTEEEENGLSTR
jgi:hypothetical protein